MRMLAAFLLFLAFGIFCCWLGRFTPRQIGTFWPIYFMLFYTIAGLWIGNAYVVIGLGITALTLIGYFFIGALVRALDGGGQRRRADPRGLVDAPELTWPSSTTSSINRCG